MYHSNIQGSYTRILNSNNLLTQSLITNFISDHNYSNCTNVSDEEMRHDGEVSHFTRNRLNSNHKIRSNRTRI